VIATAHRGRRLYLLGLFCVLAAVVAAAGCGGGATTVTTGGAGGAQGAGSGGTSASIPAGATTIAMKNTTFAPADVTIKVGQTVAWVNDDSIQHDVVANDGSFHSQLLSTNQVFTFAFTKAGSFPYYCAIHPQMTGTFTVRP
jgi:plastocyanin